MIPVTLKPEPADFDEKVRKPGKKWLRDNRIRLTNPPPDPSVLPTYWRETQKELWTAYDGVCSYLCIYFEWGLGAHSTDHFIAKSANAGQAYEWSNYRLACMGMNRNKNKFDDILDPFEINADTFILNMASGEIRPNSRLPNELREKAYATIKRLKLDSQENRDMRVAHYTSYLNNEISDTYLKRHSPFVWYEAQRQNLL